MRTCWLLLLLPSACAPALPPSSAAVTTGNAVVAQAYCTRTLGRVQCWNTSEWQPTGAPLADGPTWQPVMPPPAIAAPVRAPG